MSPLASVSHSTKEATRVPVLCCKCMDACEMELLVRTENSACEQLNLS